MDDVVNRFARELADSIAAAVSESAEVEACRERARAAGYEMKVNLEAVVGFVNRGQPQDVGAAVQTKVSASKALVPRKPFDMTVKNRASRYHLVMDALNNARRTVRGADDLRAWCEAQLARHDAYVVEHLEDLPEIRDWTLGR